MFRLLKGKIDSIEFSKSLNSTNNKMTFIRKFFCLELKTAAIVIGYLEIASYALFCISSIQGFKYEISHSKHLGLLEFLDAVDRTAILVTITIIQAILSSLLIIGTKRHNHFYLIPWLVSTTILLIYVSVLFILILFSVASGLDFEIFLIVFIFMAAYVAFRSYFSLAILSFYIQIKGTNDVNNISRVELV